MNETLSDLDSVIQLSKVPETQGFDLRAGQTWIYPTNYPVREYQFNITQAALHQNTLVSLPTGLGKTFIAAVVMYNFYRWYPLGKIIFMAPTKPLVTQQMSACYDIMAIPPNITAEMTGSKVNSSRKNIWKEKRVFFITPHILQNDLESILDLAPQIRCIVIDEAHKALGKNANCEAVKKIHKINPNFRILALSATPGNNFNSVKDVITNLLISHIEVKTNESVDVAPYVFQRKLETVVIPIDGKLLAVKNEYIKVLDKYTRPLLQLNIITGNCANLSKGRFVLTMKEFKEKSRHHSKYGLILKHLLICITLYHGFELLIRHGLRAFLKFFQENISKPLINSIGELHSIINDVEDFVEPFNDVQMLPDGTIPEIEGEFSYSHPKFEKLSQVLIDHFSQIKDADTRVMVFCEYRESVMEIYNILLRHRPLIKPRIFLGQGAISQAQQIQAVKLFKSGVSNTLVSTCIGEEGLDVGEVDLIVCFDISSKSPIRMVQRMGRTGRKRDGRVVVLVTEGKEQQLLSECLMQRNNMNILLESQHIKTFLYKENPIMIPSDIKPECNKMYITVKEPNKPIKKKNTRNNTLKKMLNSSSSSQSSSKSSVIDDNKKTKKNKSPSKAKRLPTPTKKQGDIRSMFSKINSTQSSQALSQDSSNGKIENSAELNALIAGIKSYLNTSVYSSMGCKICDNLFDCKEITYTMKSRKTTQWKKPDSSIFDKITSQSLKLFSDSFAPLKKEPQLKERNMENVLDKSLEFYKINSTSDIFLDYSSEEENDNYCNNNAILFNQSVGIFNSSNIYQATQQSFRQTPKTKMSPVKNEIIDDDLIVVSDSDTSPILCRTGRIDNYKSKIQRRLFSQTCSTPNSNISKDINQLPSSNESKMSKKVSKFSFVRKDLLNEEIKLTSKNFTSANENYKTEIKNENIMIETSKNISLPIAEQNFNIWDESLFEICDSDEGVEENLETNKEKSLEIVPVQKLSPKCSTNDYKKENTVFEDEENIKNEEENYDSDKTIILSFNTDDIFENIDKQNAELDKQEQHSSSNLINKSLHNKTNINDGSLLSVTQIIDFLNESKNNLEKSTNQKFNNVLNKSPVLENTKSNLTENIETIESSNDDINISATNEILDKLFDVVTPEKNTKNDTKANVDLTKLLDLNFDESEEEYSLLSFSQNIRKRKRENELNSDKYKIISDEIIISDDSNEKTSMNTELKLNNNFNNENKSNVKENTKSSLSDLYEKEGCLLSFSQKNRKNQNKRMKLQLQTKREADVSTFKNILGEANQSTANNVTFSQESPIKFNRKTGIPKKQAILSDSDDDFEIKPKIKAVSKINITPDKKFKRIKIMSSQTNLGSKMPSTSSRLRSKSLPTSKVKKTDFAKKLACNFIDNEAEVEDDEHYEQDSEEDSDDILESSFINDTQSVLDQTDMQGKYLQSIRSPKFKSGCFKMPRKPPPQVYDNIFSQVDNNTDNSYVNDSFCVDTDTSLSQRGGLSYLEMVEAKLEKKVRESKKRKRINQALNESD